MADDNDGFNLDDIDVNMALLDGVDEAENNRNGQGVVDAGVNVEQNENAGRNNQHPVDEEAEQNALAARQNALAAGQNARAAGQNVLPARGHPRGRNHANAANFPRGRVGQNPRGQGNQSRWLRERSHYNAQRRLVDLLYSMSNINRGRNRRAS